MLNRTSQVWPEGTAIDLSTLKEITSYGVEVEPCDECQRLRSTINEVIKILETPPDFAKNPDMENSYAFKHGWMKGNVGTSLIYLRLAVK